MIKYIILLLIFSFSTSLPALAVEGGYEPYWTDKRPEELDPPQEIIASKVNSGPAIDGIGSEKIWRKAGAETIHIAGKSGEKDITASALYTDTHVYFLFRWNDDTPETSHCRWTWDGADYREGSEHEDALVLRFSIGCDFVSTLDAGVSYDADMWYWGASRTNSSGHAADMLLMVHFQGVAEDERTKVYEFKPASMKPFWRVHQGWEGSGSPMYALEKPREKVFAIVRSDFGDLPFRRVVKPKAYTEEYVDQFISQKPAGSCADINAKGFWKDGYWTVEMGRRRVTEYQGDDWDVEPIITMSISILDGREFPEESVSKVLFFKLGGQDHGRTE